MTRAHSPTQAWTGSKPPAHAVSVGLLVSGLITALTLGVSFALLALGVEFFWVAYPVGFGFVLPTALGAVTHLVSDGDGNSGRRTDSHDDSNQGQDVEDRLDDLRMQYARGNLSDAEFERRTERLLERDVEG